MNWVERHYRWILLAASLLVTFAHLLTVSEYPPCWFDEIEILECGRFSLFDVPPEWSVDLSVTANGSLAAPTPLFHCFSGALLEALYRMTGGFLCGRIVMLLSLPFCAITLFLLLRTLEYPICVSLVTALLFLVDPNATICAHWYRPDLWCLSFAFLALVLIRRSLASRYPALQLLAAGALLASMTFFWITSVLCFLLVLPELWRMGNRNIKCIAWIAIGTIIVMILALFPLWSHIPAVINHYLTGSEISTMGTSSSGAFSRFCVRCIDFMKIAMRSPFAWMLAIIGLCLSRQRRVYGCTFVGLIVFMLMTRVYHLRMVYLMPWIFLFVAEALHIGFKKGTSLVGRSTTIIALMALISAFSISVVLLNYAAWPERNNFEEVTKQLKPTVSGNSPRVYLLDMEHEFYYAGRKLGWRLYSTSPRNAILDGNHDVFLKSIDAIIVSAAAAPLSDTDRSTLAKAGFSESSHIEMPPAATGALKSKIASFVYAHGYPSCTVWTRK